MVDNSNYRTSPGVSGSVTLGELGVSAIAVALPESAAWAEATRDFKAPSGQVSLKFQLDAAGALWMDEVWLTQLVDDGGGPRAVYPAFERSLIHGEELASTFPRRLRLWAANQYWDSVAESEILRMRDVARTIDPEFSIWANSYQQREGADYYLIELQGLEFESSLQTAGPAPGVYEPAPLAATARQIHGIPVTSEILVTNLFDYAFGHASRFPNTFAYPLHMMLFPDGAYTHNVDSAWLAHAEVGAFSGGGGVDLELKAYYTYYPDPAVWTELMDVSQAFFDFADAHPDLYRCLVRHAEVGIVFHDQPDATAQKGNYALFNGLAAQSVLVDLLVERDLTSANLRRYRAIVLQDVQRLTETEAGVLIDFANGGGLVVAAGSTGELDQHMRMWAARSGGIWPPVTYGTASAPETFALGAGTWIHSADAVEADELVAWMETSLARTPSVVSGVSNEGRVRVAAWTDGERTVLHLVNYNVLLGAENGGRVDAIENAVVQIALPSGTSVSSAELFSPEAGVTIGVLPVTIVSPGVVSVVIPTLHIYSIVELR